MKTSLLAACGIVFYMAALVAGAPASLLDFAVERATGGRLRLTQAQGTLWSGSGSLEIRSADRKHAYARAVSWRVQPRAWLTGELEYALEVQGAPQPCLITASPRRLEVQNLELRVPGAVLGIASARIAPLLLTGDITLRVPRMSAVRDGVDGDAVVRWSDAGSTLVPFVHFGAYELRAQAVGEGASATLHTLDGPLALTGEGTWAPERPLRMRVYARVAESHYEKLAPLLRLIAFERRDGVFDLALR